MKKKFLILAGILTAVCMFGGCGGASDSSDSISDNSSESISHNLKPQLYFSGDLQELYGGENGYPQAVLVAKTELVQNYGGWMNGFIESVKVSAEWLESADTATVISAVSSHLTEGMTPSLNAKNLSKSVIANCGIYFKSAEESKAEINAFLEQMLAVNPSSAATASESFYYTLAQGGDAAVVPEHINVYMPDGAPALSMAKLMHEDTAEDIFEYHVVDASTIQTFVKGGDPKADLCVLPVNLASKLLGNEETYKLLGVVTHGNLFMLSKTENLRYTSENLSELVGKTVGVIQLPNVPGLTFKIILDKYAIPWQELTGGADAATDKVNLKAVDASEITPTADYDCFVAAEPLASLRTSA